MTALDQHALDAALSAWFATYRNHPFVTDRQEFEEAVAEAMEDALSVYLRETDSGAPVTRADFEGAEIPPVRVLRYRDGMSR